MSEWISLADKWPQDADMYLVCGVAPDGERFIAVCWSPDGEDYWLMVSPLGFNDDFPDYRVYGVTHWMPLPEPPK